jgi:CDP-diglyceride synthetase
MCSFKPNYSNMNKKTLFGALGVVCLAASAAMYFIGKNSSHLSELKDFWWIPLPLGALALLLANRTK